jgi:pimeloyl-ACP methyl ester carboxylesterase
MTTTDSTQTGYAPVNGLKMYYEIHGTGRPLVLLHGAFGNVALLGDVLTVLSQNHRVIAVDLQGHGRTADIDRPLRVETMADDIAGLLQYLGVAQADIMGYSLGGGVAIQAAIRHPGIVRKLIIVSEPCKRTGFYPSTIKTMDAMGPATAEMMKPSPLYQVYTKVAPRPGDWPVLVSKVADLIRQDFDWSAGVAGIKAPTLLIFGDNDAIRPAHMVEFFGILGGGQREPNWDGSGMSTARLAILPGETHISIFRAPALTAAVIPFLDAQ